MLKIYLKTIKHEIQNGDMKYDVAHSAFYAIVDDEFAKSHTKEYGLYSDEVQSAVFYLDFCDKKRGRLVHVYGYDCFLRFKQWKEPNAKLVEHVSYKECSCTMNELMRLPAPDVIAYLKQEGLNFTLTN